MSLRWGDTVLYGLMKASVQTVHKNGDYTIDLKGARLRVPGKDLILVEKAPKK